MFRLGCALVLAALPLSAAAETLGVITAFLDGKKRIWHTITMEQSGAQIATATFQQSPRMAELKLQGHPIPEFTSKEVLSIDAQFPGQYVPGSEPSAVEILYTPNGLTGPIWISRGAPVDARLQVIELDAWGGVGRLVAVVSGEICKRPRLFSRTDPSDCMSFTGKVETRIDAQ